MSIPDDFTTLPDLAVRSLGGSVVAASDELFAERENLVRPGAPGYQAATFGHKGQVYDGWETRRRREPGHDWAIVRLGLPGVVRGVVVDTAHFTGNYPAEGDAANRFEVTAPHRLTYVRLCLYPDGGMARLRLHGQLAPAARPLPSLDAIPRPLAARLAG